MIALSAGSGKSPARECSATSRSAAGRRSGTRATTGSGAGPSAGSLCARRSVTPGRSQLPTRPISASPSCRSRRASLSEPRVGEERRVVRVRVAVASSPRRPDCLGRSGSAGAPGPPQRSSSSSGSWIGCAPLAGLAPEEPARDADERPHAPQLQREAVAVVAAGRDPDQPDVVVDGRREPAVRRHLPRAAVDRQLVGQLGRLVAPRRQVRRDQRAPATRRARRSGRGGRRSRRCETRPVWMSPVRIRMSCGLPSAVSPPSARSKIAPRRSDSLKSTSVRSVLLPPALAAAAAGRARPGPRARPPTPRGRAHCASSISARRSGRRRACGASACRR